MLDHDQNHGKCHWWCEEFNVQVVTIRWNDDPILTVIHWHCDTSIHDLQLQDLFQAQVRVPVA
jgi:hypothetical protein